MNKYFTSNTIAILLVGIASAEPIKCTIDGEILYTDDVTLCSQSEVKPINGNVSVFPAVSTAKKNTALAAPTAKQTAPPNSNTDSWLEKLGISPQDIANGWKTIIEASHRRSWQAPEMPQEEQ